MTSTDVASDFYVFEFSLCIININKMALRSQLAQVNCKLLHIYIGLIQIDRIC